MKRLFLILLLSLGCLPRGVKTDFPDEKIKINIVAHVRSKHDAKHRFPDMIKRASKEFPRNVRFSKKIVYDKVSRIVVSEGDKKHLKKIAKQDGGSIHIFFSNEIISRGSLNIIRGIKYGAPNLCTQTIVISDKALESTLVHELGHFFGLDHTDNEHNIMSQGRKDSTSSFNEEQIKKMMIKIRKYIEECV